MKDADFEAVLQKVADELTKISGKQWVLKIDYAEDIPHILQSGIYMISVRQAWSKAGLDEHENRGEITEKSCFAKFSIFTGTYRDGRCTALINLYDYLHSTDRFISCRMNLLRTPPAITKSLIKRFIPACTEIFDRAYEIKKTRKAHGEKVMSLLRAIAKKTGILPGINLDRQDREFRAIRIECGTGTVSVVHVNEDSTGELTLSGLTIGHMIRIIDYLNDNKILDNTTKRSIFSGFEED